MTRSVAPAPQVTNLRANRVDDSTTSYVVAATAKLPTVDISITLGAALFGRASDINMNTWLIRLAKRQNVWLHVLTPLACSACAAVFTLQSRKLSLIATAVSIGFMSPLTILLLSTLSRDLLRLSSQTFEFWFLTTLNVLGAILCYNVFGDHRSWAMIPLVPLIQVIICLDGSVYTRRFLARATMLAPPGMLVSMVPCAQRYTPRIVVSSITVGNGHKIHSVDVIFHCYSSMAIFAATKVFRCRHLIWPSRKPNETIRCEPFFPFCHLVQNSDRSASNVGHQKSNGHLCRLELVDDELPGIIHTSEVLAPMRMWSWLGACITTIGSVGAFVGVLAVGWHAFHGKSVQNPSTPQLALAIVGCVSLIICFVFYLAQAQRVLFRRLLTLDAWYVSYQFTIVTVGIADVLFWDERVWLDEVFELIVDIVMYTPDVQAKVEKARKLEIRLDVVFAFIESRIQGDFLLGETLSLADIHIFCMSQSVQVVLPSYTFASFPKITTTITSVKAVPKIAAYLTSHT